MTTVQPLPDRLALLDTIDLKRGSHPAFQHGACAMEAVAWLAGEEHTDHPSCTCPVIAAFVRRFNDDLNTNEKRNELIRPLIPTLIGTRASKDVERKRGYLAADWAVRECLPKLLRYKGQIKEAERCEKLAPIVDEGSALKAKEIAKSIYALAATYADAAYAAALAAAYAAADALAAAAALAATYAAAALAAALAAAYAAADAAYAAYAAAADADIHSSAVNLIARMCALT